jgi:DNA-3-methyladenine glycosylase I
VNKDFKIRCSWCEKDDLYQKYHDQEWGIPVYDDQKLFEYLLLETFQAGVSWYLILKKRENFRKAFMNFDYRQIAFFDEFEVQALMKDSGIIRNSLKIKSAINNAKVFMVVQQEFGSFSNYIWAFVDRKPIVNQYQDLNEIPAFTPLAEKISKDMKKRGFKFIGPTTMYAHMQATGMVNDHLIGCWTRN